MYYVAVYGTLKKGHGNHRLVEGRYIKTTKIANFNLYTTGYIPFAIPSKDPMDQIVIEVYYVTPSSYKMMRQLELGAGYKEILVSVDTLNATMWIYDDPNIVREWRLDKVPDNNWTLEEEDKWEMEDIDDIDIELDDDADVEFADDEDDDYINDLSYVISKDDFYDKGLEEPLDPTIPCECTDRGIKASWEWEKHLKAWRCEKCGEVQE